jgi:hypothetical protein
MNEKAPHEAGPVDRWICRHHREAMPKVMLSRASSLVYGRSYWTGLYWKAFKSPQQS